MLWLIASECEWICKVPNKAKEKIKEIKGLLVACQICSTAPSVFNLNLIDGVIESTYLHRNPIPLIPLGQATVRSLCVQLGYNFVPYL